MFHVLYIDRFPNADVLVEATSVMDQRSQWQPFFSSLCEELQSINTYALHDVILYILKA